MADITAAEIDKARAGDVRALARLISLVEDESPQVRSVIKDLLPDTGGARVIGLTGAPGVGKSTVTGALLRAFRAAGREEDFRRLTGTLVASTAALRRLGWAPSISTREGLAALMRNSEPG